jgi:hypothetical protein
MSTGLTVQRILPRRLGLRRTRRGRSGLARSSDFATLPALDFFLQDGGFLLDLAEAVLESVVGCAEVFGCGL